MHRFRLCLPIQMNNVRPLSGAHLHALFFWTTDWLHQVWRDGSLVDFQTICFGFRWHIPRYISLKPSCAGCSLCLPEANDRRGELSFIFIFCQYPEKNEWRRKMERFLWRHHAFCSYMLVVWKFCLHVYLDDLIWFELQKLGMLKLGVLISVKWELSNWRQFSASAGWHDLFKASVK